MSVRGTPYSPTELTNSHSSMVSAIVARVGPHSDVAGLAKNSTVPVINALSDVAHPLQIVADFLAIHEAFQSSREKEIAGTPGLGLEGLKIAWVGDSNNVLYDLACASAKLGVHVAVATPKGYEIPTNMRQMIQQAAAEAKSGSKLIETNVPEEAIQNADVLVTDTWVSMGQEEEKAKRFKAFEGFQITDELAQRGGAKPGWKVCIIGSLQHGSLILSSSCTACHGILKKSVMRFSTVQDRWSSPKPRIGMTLPQALIPLKRLLISW